MIFSGLIKQSLIDYPGNIAAVAFTSGCNLRCPFCHNPHLIHKTRQREIDQERLYDFLKERKDFLDGLVITGGEPTLHHDLPDVVQHIKDIGYKVKIDTNGSNCQMLKRLLDNNLVDCIAMDIKAPLDFKKYLSACGKISREEFLNIRNSIVLLKDCLIEVVFRTTVVPKLHSREDIVKIAKSIEGSTTYCLQQYNPQHVYNSAFENIVPYPSDKLHEMAGDCRLYVKEVKVINL